MQQFKDDQLTTIKPETAAMLFLSRQTIGLRVRLMGENFTFQGDDLIVICSSQNTALSVNNLVLVSHPGFAAKQNFRIAKVLSVLPGFWCNINMSESTAQLCYASTTAEGMSSMYNLHLRVKTLSEKLHAAMKESGKRAHLNGVEVPHETAKMRYCELVPGVTVSRLDQMIAESSTEVQDLIFKRNEKAKYDI